MITVPECKHFSKYGAFVKWSSKLAFFFERFTSVFSKL